MTAGTLANRAITDLCYDWPRPIIDFCRERPAPIAYFDIE